MRISTTAPNVVPDLQAYYPRAHWAIEQMLSQPHFEDMHWTSLQPNVFFPYVLGTAAEFVKEHRKTGKQGQLSLMLAADAPVGVIDAIDVGNVAAHLLVQDDTRTHNQARLILNGPEDLTGQKIVALVEKHIGTKVEDVKYKDVSFIDKWADAVTTGSKNLIRSLTHAPEVSWAGKTSASTTSEAVLKIAAPQTTAEQYFGKMI